MSTTANIMAKFIGRKKELEHLERFLKKNSASLLVVKGRRRIGKSRLIEELANINKIKLYEFTGLAPTDQITDQHQRDEFARKIGEYFNLPGIKGDNWGDLFTILSSQLKKNRAIVLLDEISWLADKDPTFLAKLKNAWDTQLKLNDKLVLIFCGSASLWIEKNILSSTAFMGRISYTLTLSEMPLCDCNEFWLSMKDKVSSHEKLKVLSVTGGVPKYLEEIDPAICAEENIKRLCFQKGGLLTNEFDQIFSELFSTRNTTYRKIINVLVNGSMEYKDICNRFGMEPSGLLSEYLNDLIKAGFISRDFTWHIKTEETSRLSHYRLSDNYLRFYLKYIAKNIKKIELDSFSFKSLAALSGWDSIMGLQFENLVLNNRQYIQQCLGIKPDEVVSDNPFFQKTTLRTSGCQIDYLIQTTFRSLYVCEIKFSVNKISTNVIDQMQKKLSRLKIPRGFSYRPVLIHVNGVTDAVIDRHFFAEIIDFSNALESNILCDKNK